MAMIKCKECKQEVAASAKACPHCGAADPALSTGSKLAGCGITVALFLGVLFGVTSCLFSGPDDNASTTATSPADSGQQAGSAQAEQKTLGITLPAYASRVNSFLEQLDRPYRLDTSDIDTRGKVNDVLKAKMGGHAVLLATISRSNGEILDVTLLTSGDGTPRSGAEVMMAASAAINAAIPDSDLGATAKWMNEVMADRPVSYGRVEISTQKSEQLGLWFMAKPI